MKKENCACLLIKYDPVYNYNGTVTDRWRCVSCNAEFTRDTRKQKDSLNKMMLEFIKDIYFNDIGFKYQWVRDDSKELIEKAEGKSIDEIIKEMRDEKMPDML